MEPNPNSLRPVCLVLAGLAMVAGALGMAMSFLYLASASMADITAGASGFVAGSVLIGAGLLSLTTLAAHGPKPPPPPRPEARHSEPGVPGL